MRGPCRSHGIANRPWSGQGQPLQRPSRLRLRTPRCRDTLRKSGREHEAVAAGLSAREVRGRTRSSRRGARCNRKRPQATLPHPKHAGECVRNRRKISGGSIHQDTTPDRLRAAGRHPPQHPDSRNSIPAAKYDCAPRSHRKCRLDILRDRNPIENGNVATAHVQNRRDAKTRAVHSFITRTF